MNIYERLTQVYRHQREVLVLPRQQHCLYIKDWYISTFIYSNLQVLRAYCVPGLSYVLGFNSELHIVLVLY